MTTPRRKKIHPTPWRNKQVEKANYSITGTKACDAKDRAFVPYTRWTRAQIEKTYTPAYVDTVLAQANENIERLDLFENGMVVKE